MLERVRNKFLRRASHLLKIECPHHNYSPVLHNFNLLALADRKRIANLNFLVKLLNGQNDSPSLISLVSFEIPVRRTRQRVPFNLLLITL